MQTTNIIEKLKKSGLTGRGGAGFPVWQKWQKVKTAKVHPVKYGSTVFNGARKYIICNASEGEPGVFKDKFILKNFGQDVVEGIKIALKTINHSTAYIYLNKDYYPLFQEKLQTLIKNQPIKLFEKPSGYLAGEETTLLNAIEGKRLEPRLKPPYPTEIGLFGLPTLINNVETFYWVSKIAKNEYKNKRFFCIGSNAKNKGVFELPENLTIEQILHKTDNYPSVSQNESLDFFVQVGGAASGEILLAHELEKPLKGVAAIIMYERSKTELLPLFKKWAEFFIKENCDLCAPCREGIYRLYEIFGKNQDKPLQTLLNPETKEKISDVLDVLEKTGFCPLAKMASVPFRTALEKLL